MHNNLTGRNFLGNQESGQGAERVCAFDPLTGDPMGASFFVATLNEVDAAAEKAGKAFEEFASIQGEQRAKFLEKIAENLESLGTDICQTAMAETALPMARLEGELKRTTGQIRMFARLIEDGSWVEARLDSAIADRQPLPKPDMRRMMVPIGPIAVFGSSNFPLAYSVMGGDSASALAAGCPVVVKAHQAHPSTSEMAVRAALRAAAETGMPDGVVSMVHGTNEVGARLVTHSCIAGVGFTGSLRGGRALFDLANARPVPIPVFAEMGSVNPVFLLPSTMELDWEALARGYANSLTMGVGQFCTNPGIAVVLDSAESQNWLSELVAKVQDFAGTMLTPNIAGAYCSGVNRMAHAPGVTSHLASGKAGHPAIFSCEASTFLSSPELTEEIFGPCCLIVRCATLDELMTIANSLSGQLTASIHSKSPEEARSVARAAAKWAGRVIYNGWPTGLEVCPSTQHGGPYPASTDSRFTAVGSAAILRWVRPVCWQNFPEELLPEELQKANPKRIRRMEDGLLY